MARSLRSNRGQVNKSNLRKKVFNPVEHARAERLSAKLLELAQQPKPERTEMEVEKTNAEEPVQAVDEEQMEDAGIENGDVEMDDAQAIRAKKPQSKAEQRRKSAKAHKVQKRRAKKSTVFPRSKNTGKCSGPGLKKGKKR